MRTLALIAQREFIERIRSRAFLFANAFIIVLVVGVVALSAAARPDRGTGTRFAYVEDEGRVVAEVASRAVARGDVSEPVVGLRDRASAVEALRAGEVDAVMLDGQRVLVVRGLDTITQVILGTAVELAATDRLLAEAGVDDDLRARIAEPPVLAVERLDGADARVDIATPAVLVATVASFVLYGLLALFGQWVAQGIVEEKQSRVVEVLLGTVRPSQLLVGRIIGLGGLGLVQLSLLLSVGAVGIIVGDVIRLPAQGWSSIVLTLVWYVPGFLLFALLFSAAGAMVDRVEDLQSAVLVPMVILIVALVAAQATLFDPSSTFARVAMVVPFTAPIVHPILIAAGAIGAGEVLAAVVSTLVTLAVLVPLVARIYRGGVLPNGGASGLRAAWRAGR